MPRKTAVPPVPAFDPAEQRDLGTLTDAELGFAPVEEAEFTEVPEEKPVPEPAPIRALTTTSADHHLVVGMATLANMSEEEFERNLAIMEKGQARIRTIMERLLKEGEDYGKVKGIARPFLHQPGAEKLGNFYGFAVRQEVDRVVRRVGDAPEIPPYAYHVKSYVHLGDTSGPIVAEGSGEANPYEDKYHYRFIEPACPQCGKSNTIITRKTPEALKGKKQCMNFGGKDGCGTIFEPSDPRLVSTGKEATPDMDLFGLAETILQMAAKRSLVASIRRATGTSGLFTQDDDSPSVRQQSEAAADPDGTAPVVTSAQPIGVPVAPGGRTTQVTQVQLDRLKVLGAEKGLNGAKIANLLDRLFGMDVAATGAAASAAVRTLNADQMGQLLLTVETGDLPTPTAAEIEAADQGAYATHPDDIGAK